MSKQQTSQKFIFKIHTSRLRKANWKLTLPVAEARKNDEVIALADSQCLRWIDELNGITDADAKAKEIKAEIKQLKKEPNNYQNRKIIKQLYSKLDNIQFKPDYISLVIDRDKDYRRAMKGFSINGISYKRLVSTVGGMKTGTVVFVSERLVDELTRRIDNGRDMTKNLVPAKLEAYRALACSASTPVSMPHGIVVVHDAFTKYVADTIYLNDEEDGEPVMEDRPGTQIEMDCTDGFGMMMPSLAERWSRELGLDYTMAGCNTRCSFEKGMVFTFDFVDFAEKVAHNYLIQDVWGNEVDIRNVELVFTESMLKLWDSYSSMDDYMQNCEENEYSVCVTKTCPKALENERALNYQFIQSYKLTDEDIEELISPTIDEIKDVLGGDWRKTILFMCGGGLTDSSVTEMDGGFIKAVMACPELVNDPFVSNSIYQLIKNRINEAKVGVIKVHGNYSIVSGDPYTLCQSIFGLELTGLLKAGQIYNKYWVDCGAEKLACYRAPMTCHNNIRLVEPAGGDDIDYWYRYMNTCTIFNSWDTATAALNGCDFDGDLVMLTDNNVLVNRLVVTPAVCCVQRKATKKIVTEEDIVQANIDGFGNDIGKVTNRVTSMFELQSKFNETDEEYKILEYRIKCGQLIQQNIIDKSKGIVAKPMPRVWYDRHAVNQIEDEGLKRLYRSIVADKKPYFMRYIYPDLMKQYNTYIKNTDRNAMREFNLNIDELMAMPVNEMTERQRDFLRYYEVSMPVGMHDCVMNKICRRFEREFDSSRNRRGDGAEFDYTVLKSGTEYTKQQMTEIVKLYEQYNKKLQSYAIFSQYERPDADESAATVRGLRDEFMRECEMVCQNQYALCDILLDVCYRRNTTKRFVWDMYADVIIENLLEKNGGKMWYPAQDEHGDINYCGNKYSVCEINMESAE